MIGSVETGGTIKVSASAMMYAASERARAPRHSSLRDRLLPLLLLVGCSFAVPPVAFAAAAAAETSSSAEGGTTEDAAGRVLFSSFVLSPFDCTTTALQTAEDVRAAAEDCLRQTVPTTCGYTTRFIGLGNAVCNNDSSGSDDGDGDGDGAVLIRGGVMDFTGSAYEPTHAEVMQCLQTALQSAECLDAVQVYFPGMSSIGYAVPAVATPPTPPTPTAPTAPTSPTTTLTTPITTTTTKGSALSEESSSTLVPLIGSAAGGALLLGMLGFISFARNRRDSSGGKHKSGSVKQVMTAQSCSQSEEEEEEDLEVGCVPKKSLSKLDSMKNPSASEHDDEDRNEDQPPLKDCRLGRILASNCHRSEDNGDRRIRVVVDDDDDDGHTPTTAKNSSHNGEGSNSSSIEEEEVVLILDDDDDDDGYVSSSSSSCGDDERNLVYRTSSCYDTRPVLVDAEERQQQQHVIIVHGSDEEDDDNDNDDQEKDARLQGKCTSQRTKCGINPGLVASLQNYRQVRTARDRAAGLATAHGCNKGDDDYDDNNDDDGDCVEQEFYSSDLLISAAQHDDDNNSSSNSSEIDVADCFEPDQEWDPDDNSVSTVDAAGMAMTGTGELSFQACSTTSKMMPLSLLEMPLPIRNSADEHHCDNRSSSSSSSSQHCRTRSLVEWLRTPPPPPSARMRSTSTSSLPELNDRFPPSPERGDRPRKRRCSTPRLYLN